MRVLVTGGRNYTDRERLYAVLDRLHREAWIDCLIQGGANGADKLAREWCEDRRVQYENYPADWESHGSFAGPMRNKQMLDEGRPHSVIAFPGGRGTADMVRKARKAGVEVIEIAP